jgi:hypothetical protein
MVTANLEDTWYLQSINSNKHQPQSPFTGQFFRWRHFALVSLQLISPWGKSPWVPEPRIESGLYSQHYYIQSFIVFLCEVNKRLNFSAKMWKGQMRHFSFGIDVCIKLTLISQLTAVDFYVAQVLIKLPIYVLTSTAVR